jgi:hypothetical protein
MIRFAQPGACPKLGPLGRTVRLLLGGYLLYEFVDMLTHYPSYFGLSGPGTTWWFTTAVSLWLLSIAIEVSVGGAWVRRVLLGVPLLGLATAPFSLLLYAVDLLGFGFTGLSLILSVILAFPGCEAGAIPSLVAKRYGREAAQHY